MILKCVLKDIKTNFMFHEEVVKIIPKVLNKKRTTNVGCEI